MKTDKYILIVATAVLAVASCSEKSTASLESLRDKAEDHLVQAAGEGDVAIRLMQNQFGAVKEKLVTLKTMKATYTRRLAEAEAQAASMRQQGKEEAAAREDRRATLFSERLAWLGDRDTKAEEELKICAENYAKRKLEIEGLQEELALYKAAAGVSGTSEIGPGTQSRAARIKELEETLRQHIDRAKSIVEIEAPEIE